MSPELAHSRPNRTRRRCPLWVEDRTLPIWRAHRSTPNDLLDLFDLGQQRRLQLRCLLLGGGELRRRLAALGELGHQRHDRH